MRAYSAANRDKISERMHAYREVNRDKISERNRAYSAANRDKISERMHAYREDLISAGLCTNCGEPSLSTWYCWDCLNKRSGT